MIQEIKKIEWPEEITRTNLRRIGHRKESWHVAVEALRQILGKLGVINGFISYDDNSVSVQDPAIVVQFTHHRRTYIYAYDQYLRPEHNLMAIVEVLQAEYIKSKYNIVVIAQKN